METERGDDLREAKRSKSSPAMDAISFKSEEVPSAEMNVDVERLGCDPVPSSEMDVDVDVVPLPILSLGSEYSAMLKTISEEVYSWHARIFSHQTNVAPALEEECVFSEDEVYSVESDDDYLIPISPDIQQLYQDKYVLDRYKKMNLALYKAGYMVLSDMELVMRWKCSPFESMNCQYVSDDPSVPKSVVIAKQVIVENKLIIGLSEILECLWDFYTELRLQKDLFGYKMYEEFLLNFWEKNKREPTHEEIKDKFCQGCFPTDKSTKFCSVIRCFNPAPGKLCYGNLIYEVDDMGVGEELLEELQDGCSREGGLKIIEESYQKRLFEPCHCRAHFLKAKLDEVVKSGLDTEIREVFPSYDNVVVRSEHMDIKVPIEQFDRSKRAYGHEGAH